MSEPSTRIEFRYLSEPDMIRAGVTDMPACVDAMEECFRLIHVGDYRMAGENADSHGAPMTFPAESPHPDMPQDGPDRRFMAMPAYLGGSFRMTGCKWYGSNMANKDKGLPRSILMFMLNDTDTGAPLALMSANLLSAYRTGAISGVGARHLAREDARVVGIVGPGVMARTTLAAFLAARPGIDTVKIKGRGSGSTQTFVDWVRAEFPQVTTAVAVETIEAAVRDSDIVSFCTSGAAGDPSTYPTVEYDWVKPGAFFAMPSLCDIDERMAGPAVRKVVDALGLYEAWAEEMPYPVHQTVPMIGCRFMDMIHDGELAASEVGELTAIVGGAQPGRRSEDEIIIMSVGGMPVEDVAWGTIVYRRAVADDIGVLLTLWDSPALS